MSNSLSRRQHRTEWWQKLALRPDALGVTGDLHGTAEGGLAVLQEYEPVSFAPKNAGGKQVTIDELRELIAVAERTHQREINEAKAVSAEQRRVHGWERINAAYASPDAEEVIHEGRWAGFSRADATAWCWNLFQYEPSGFVHPGSEIRVRATNELEAGGLPEVFGYPERARAHQARGLTPRQYREHKEALGANTFTAADIIRS